MFLRISRYMLCKDCSLYHFFLSFKMLDKLNFFALLLILSIITDSFQIRSQSEHGRVGGLFSGILREGHIHNSHYLPRVWEREASLVMCKEPRDAILSELLVSPAEIFTLSFPMSLWVSSDLLGRWDVHLRGECLLIEMLWIRRLLPRLQQAVIGWRQASRAADEGIPEHFLLSFF